MHNMSEASSYDIQVSIDLRRLMALSDGPLKELSDKEKDQVVSRYIQFLRLCREHVDKWLAPAQDIDELWHLHMLSPCHYYNDCIYNFGEILNHDFKGVQEPPLSRESIISNTCKLWRSKFGEEMCEANDTRSLKLAAIATSHGHSYRAPF